MKIQTVTYSRLVSGPNFSNQTIGATAEVEGVEAPENALAALESWVAYQHELRRKTSQDLYQAEQDVWERKSTLRKIEDQIAAATERWEQVKAVSAALGVDLTARLGAEADLENVPF
jgi:hypothetical protein